MKTVRCEMLLVVMSFDMHAMQCNIHALYVFIIFSKQVKITVCTMADFSENILHVFEKLFALHRK